MATDGFWAVCKIRGGEVAYNYGYKTLNAGPFEQIEYLSIKTGKGSKDDPFIIANSRLLQKIDNLEIKTDGKWTASCSYSVANDINLSKIQIVQIGTFQTGSLMQVLTEITRRYQI